MKLIQKNTTRILTENMATYRVHGEKFHDMDRLNDQIKKVMRRYGHQFGYFEIGEMYEIDGTVNLFLE